MASRSRGDIKPEGGGVSNGRWLRVARLMLAASCVTCFIAGSPGCQMPLPDWGYACSEEAIAPFEYWDGDTSPSRGEIKNGPLLAATMHPHILERLLKKQLSSTVLGIQILVQSRIVENSQLPDYSFSLPKEYLEIAIYLSGSSEPEAELGCYVNRSMDASLQSARARLEFLADQDNEPRNCEL